MAGGAFATLSELRAELAARRVGAVELAQACLDRIAAQAHLNAFVSTCPERALARAEAADRRIAKEGQTALVGLPFAHKDIFCVQGLPTTCASNMLADFVAPYDATVAARMDAAGAVLVGKTNMDEFAMGSSSETGHLGSVRNPWDTGRVAGGSSGGSAAAVAAGLVPAATGTDTGGSIRQPAAFCGVSGLKPTYGRVSRYGMIAFASSLDQGGPMARTAEDLRLLLACMEGRDPRDSTSADVPPTAAEATPRPLRIGIPGEYWDALGTDMGTALDAARRGIEGLGHNLAAVSLPHTRAAVAAYYVISSAEASTNLSRYDGVRYGHRASAPKDLEDLYRRSRSEGFGDEVKRRILTGAYTLSVGYYDAYYQKAQRVRRLIRQDFLDAFASVDAILAPVTPTPAFELDAMQADPTDMYRQDAFTVPASLAGLPALSVPCGQIGGLPVGMQLIGPHFAEDRLLALGEAWQRETDWHMPHPRDSRAGPEAT
ncbi:MAG: Asp-tRNA(Asn)/Glu-tRNA(Gln) amidotransferase subunit GatA [Gammaproteobacteria bacterium]|nr:Asp-tRNA(Asn)/Glu-tRNA(Gln) amidotransferase subunit GatA [Gammaproteobacteria bacterium]